jgi:competence protein ComEA
MGAMRDLSRAQLLLYGAVAAALLVVGFRWVHGSGGGGGAASPVGFQSGASSASGRGSSGESFSVGASSEDVVVDVAGAVRRPGVYRMPAGARVNDAVARAGGAGGGANLEAINLAARLSDGQQVVVPAKAAAGASAGVAAAGAATAATGPISLGSATEADLDTIEGIGPVTAQKIIEFRDQHGGVSSIDELSQISGIGPATMEALRARLQP